MTDAPTTNVQPAVIQQPAQPTAQVGEIPSDDIVDSGVSGTDTSKMTASEGGIQESGDVLGRIYVGKAKGKKYLTAPLGDMMPKHFYRATSTMAQPPLATLRWVLQMFLFRSLNDHAAANPESGSTIVDPQWQINLPAHLNFEAALELARVPEDFRPYALYTMALMTATSKSRGVPEITAKANPYTGVLPKDNMPMRQKFIADMVCSLRTDARPSPFAMFGTVPQSQGTDPIADFVRAQRGDTSKPVDCYDALLTAVKAGLRLWRGVGARKCGEKHENLLQCTQAPLNPEAPLYDANIRLMTGGGISHTQDSDIDSYLDITAAFMGLVQDARYAGYMQTVMNPPVDQATGQAVYDDAYHKQVSGALARLPRWSWAKAYDPVDEEALTWWEHHNETPTANKNAIGVLRTMQAVGMFASTATDVDYVEGVGLSESMTSRIDPTLVEAGGHKPHNYAAAKFQLAQQMEGMARDNSRKGALLPAHASVIKAASNPSATKAWMDKQQVIKPVELPDIVGELEYRCQLLRQLLLDQSAMQVDAYVAQTIETLCASHHPAMMLDVIEVMLRQAVDPSYQEPVSQGQVAERAAVPQDVDSGVAAEPPLGATPVETVDGVVVAQGSDVQG